MLDLCQNATLQYELLGNPQRLEGKLVAIPGCQRDGFGRVMNTMQGVGCESCSFPAPKVCGVLTRADLELGISFAYSCRP